MAIRRCCGADFDPNRPKSEQVWCTYSPHDPEHVQGRHQTKDEAIAQEEAVYAHELGVYDVKAKDVDLMKNYWRVIFRPKEEFIEFRTPDWAAHMADFHAPGTEVVMGLTKAGNWFVQSILVPEATYTKGEAVHISEFIQDKLESEGAFAPLYKQAELQGLFQEESDFLGWLGDVNGVISSNLGISLDQLIRAYEKGQDPEDAIADILQENFG